MEKSKKKRKKTLRAMFGDRSWGSLLAEAAQRKQEYRQYLKTGKFETE